MIVIESPTMNPVTTDLVRKSEMKPSRARPPATSIPPTIRARAAVSPRYAEGSRPARSAITDADITAIVELTVTLRWRLEPITA
jgi:hypothetical protein